MKENREERLKIVAGVVISVLIIATIVILVQLNKYLKKESADAVELIPQNTICIVKTRAENAQEILQNILVEESDAAKNEIKQLLDIAIYNNQWINCLNDIYLSIHQVNKTCGCLGVFPIEKQKYKSFQKLIDHADYLQTKYKDFTIYQLDTLETSFYFYLHRGVMAISEDIQLIRLSINSLNQEKILPNIEHDKKTKIIYNHSNYLNINASILNYYEDEFSRNLFSAFQPMVLNMTYKNQQLILTGEIHTDFPLISKSNQIQSILEVIPEGVAHLFALEESDFNLLHKQEGNQVSSNKWMQIFHPQTIAYFNLIDSNRTYTYLLICPKDLNSVEETLFFQTEKTFNYENICHVDYDTFYIDNHLIGRIDIPNFVLQKWDIGKQMLQLKNYSIHDDYLIFSATDSAMIAYWQAIENNNIQTDTGFNELNRYFNTNSSIIYYNKQNNKHIKRYQLEQNTDSTYFFSYIYCSTSR